MQQMNWPAVVRVLELAAAVLFLRWALPALASSRGASRQLERLSADPPHVVDN